MRRRPQFISPIFAKKEKWVIAHSDIFKNCQECLLEFFDKERILKFSHKHFFVSHRRANIFTSPWPWVIVKTHRRYSRIYPKLQFWHKIVGICVDGHYIFFALLKSAPKFNFWNFKNLLDWLFVRKILSP